MERNRMHDGWTDKKIRTIIHLLVNNPKEDMFLKFIDAFASKMVEKVFEMMESIVEEMNVVQDVVDNAANYKFSSQMLMAKRKWLFWTPCVAHCLGIMLEDYEKRRSQLMWRQLKGKTIKIFIYSRTSLNYLLQHFT